MTTESTPRLALPYLQPGQAQKELFHNEALTRIDLTLQGAAESLGDTEPPADPDIGNVWIVGELATGAWTGFDRHIAGWTSGGWRFVMPCVGMQMWITAQNCFATFDGDDWRLGEIRGRQLLIGGVQVVGNQLGAIAVPSGGITIDTEARASIAAILGALQAHGLLAGG